jgi:hypothetical protein
MNMNAIPVAAFEDLAIVAVIKPKPTLHKENISIMTNA